MDNIILLFACLMLGIGLQHSPTMPRNTHIALNAFIINVALPALALRQVHQAVLPPA